MSATEQDASRRNNSTAKVVAVLDALGTARRVADLAVSTGLPKSTVHRILQDLVLDGFCEVDDAGGYRPGPRFVGLAGRVVGRLDAVAGADPALARLRDATGATVHLGVLSGDEAVYVRKLEASKPYRMASRVGMAVPLHCTAIGKAILAALPEDEAVAIVTRAGQPPRTPRTLATVEDLLADLVRTRDRGWSLDDEENELGVVCVGAPVFGSSGKVLGAVSISQLRDDAAALSSDRIGPLVRRAAWDASADLGQH